MGVSVREAIAADLPAVHAIARAAYAPYVARLGFEPPPMVQDFAADLASGDLWVARGRGDLCGYVVFRRREADVYLDNVAVAPDRHGRGVGRALIGHVEGRAAALGLPVLLHTNVVMTENLAIYPRLGYREIDRRTEDGLHRVYFRKDPA